MSKSDNTETTTLSLKRKDWHDYNQIYIERHRKGLGENGKAALSLKENKALNRDVFKEYGYYANLSEKISLNRSVPDTRDPKCKKKLYLEQLPTVSIIIPFYKEHWSTMLRTVFSVLNRSPTELVQEILLVNDGNNKDGLDEIIYKKLQGNLNKLKVIHQPNHTGLAAARVAGAKAATANVLVFLDSHTEVNINWLPPLLEPIAFDRKTVVVPIIDVIVPRTFRYRKDDNGARGTFNWELNYMRLPLTPKDENNMPEPFETPVMLGGLLAISRTYFLELGGYDVQFYDWGGEQYELSFKIWMCGGRILEAPCSRVGHVYRYPHRDMRFTVRNYRRVAEVWMDEYKEYLYLRRADVRACDPGDLTQQKALRRKLGCKPFKWFITQVAFDLTQRFPLIEPMPYAEGRIRPTANPHLCVDGNHGKWYAAIVLKPCDPVDEVISVDLDEQNFELTWFNDVMFKSRVVCWETNDKQKVMIFPCHQRGGNQQWRYFRDTKQFLSLYTSKCLDHNATTLALLLSPCDHESLTQRWDIDTIYGDRLAKWNENHTISITGPVEEWDAKSK